MDHREIVAIAALLLASCSSPVTKPPMEPDPTTSVVPPLQPNLPLLVTSQSPPEQSATSSTVSPEPRSAGESKSPRHPPDAPSKDVSLEPSASVHKELADEVVVAAPALSGDWKWTSQRPYDYSFSVFKGAKVFYSDKVYDYNVCAFKDVKGVITTACGGGAAPEGTFDGTNLTLRWGVALAHSIFRGKLSDDGTISGTFSIAAMGVGLAEFPLTLRKLTGTTDADSEPESATLLRLVLDDLARRELAADRYDDKVAAFLRASFSSDKPAEAPQSIKFLMKMHVYAPKEKGLPPEVEPPASFQDLYRVSFPSGDKYCRILIKEPRKVVDFDCREGRIR